MILDDKDIFYTKPDPKDLVIEHYGSKMSSGPTGWQFKRDKNGNIVEKIPPVGWIDPNLKSENGSEKKESTTTRFNYGSDKESYEKARDFKNRISQLKKEGLSEKEVADYFGMSIKDFKLEQSVATNEDKLDMYSKIRGLSEKGLSNREICRQLGWSESKESTIRNYLKDDKPAKVKEVKELSDFLKEQVNEKKYIDVGFGTERDLNVKRDRLNTAIYDLKMQGYNVYQKYVKQPTNKNQETTFSILCAPGVSRKEVLNLDTKDINFVKDFESTDDGKTFHKKFEYPASLDSKRLKIRYSDEVGPDGAKGIDKDGVIEIRRGLDDLSLGNKKYAQVRILVDEDKYLKGMCVYSDNIPDGYDVVFNTNKTSDKSMYDVLKTVKKDKDGNIDRDNPFGSNIKPSDEGGQYHYKDKDGNDKLGLLNLVRDEGDWSEWSKNVPSQFLAKQPLDLAKRQLNKKYEEDLEEFNEICSLENPTVKKRLLKEFSDECDSAAVHLKAAALPGQQYHVILPINSLKDNEVYAPNYPDGTRLALIRYPHAGTFEIPELVVNNKNKVARELLGTTLDDAVGINSKIAAQLSGADFDGDTVMVIPNSDKLGIKSRPYLKELEGFDPKVEYATNKVKRIGKDGNPVLNEKGEQVYDYYDDKGKKVKVISERYKQIQMGVVSNLITDMTLFGAPDDEIAKAVKHSMVIIDSEKHKLNYQKSAKDNDFEYLKNRYQRKWDEEKGEWVPGGGATTLISRAKSPVKIPKRQGQPTINAKYRNGKPNPNYNPDIPEGSYVYKTSDKAYYPKRISKDPDNPNIIGYESLDGTLIKFDKTNSKDREYYMANKEPVKDEKTGEVLYFTNKTGDLKYRYGVEQIERPRMELIDDAYELLSYRKKPMEIAYADYANKMKALANQARKEIMYTKDIDRDTDAATKYSNEVNSLMTKLNDAYKNKIPEKKATALANSTIEAKKKSYPDLSGEELRKVSQQAMERAREITGSKRGVIDITDNEWKAIQSGAISKTKLSEILNYTDMDIIRDYAMPKNRKELTTQQISSMKNMINLDRYTNQQIADKFGVSVGYVKKIKKGE
ncbi:MAG: helix-turn-helix domain-containing protein [Anaeroplasma sp.]